MDMDMSRRMIDYPPSTFQLNGQKAFLTGKLKTKGNMMLATKLDGLLQVGGDIMSLVDRTY